MAKYSSYIELSPTYESVVDADSEKRNPNLWHDYIVHEDMRNAVDKICQSVKEETKDARRSFWIHGAYGTGKTYAALVIKHLFEDEIGEVSRFLSRDLLMPYRNKFISIRERGDFLVIWKSGCTGIRSGMQLMMEMEVAIRDRLKEKFGDKAYYGSRSLINSVKAKLNDRSINWDHVFDDQEFGLFEDYVSMDELRQDIEHNDLKAADRVAKIMMEKGWGLMNNVDNFLVWIKDVIESNRLNDGGIIFIWDEFTGFLRDCGDDNVLQRLSEYCKQQPFFLFLIVHRDPGWVENMGEQTYRRIMHRYHELEFHISESAAYDLIGNSILIRPGMEEQWADIKKDLIDKIKKYLPSFDQLDMNNVQDRISQLCPIHPMTISMLAIVAQNFGASQRTLFRFMKDAKEAEENVGFTYYIKNNSPDEWRWLTPDYLWDYFFTRESDMKELSSEAKKCHMHFLQHQEFAGSETAQHIFKAIMLLIAVMSTTKTTYLHSAISKGRVSATKKSLYLCFAGQLTSEDIDKYLEIFEENGLVRLDRMSYGDSRLELPYSGQSDVFSLRLEQMGKKYTRYQLLAKGGKFSEVLEKRFSDDADAINNRMIISACSSDANSVNVRYKELSDDLVKNPHKVGILLIVPKEASEYQSLPAKAKSLLQGEETGRMVIGIIREALTEDILDRWREAMTHSELAAEEGKRGSADRYYNEALALVEGWVGPAINGQITAFGGEEGVTYTSWGRADLTRRIKDGVIFSIFSAAPERFIVTSTAFRRANDIAALCGISGDTDTSLLKNILNPLKDIGVYEVLSIEALSRLDDGKAGTFAVAKLASFVDNLLSRGARVKLDEMWQELQKEPFGYYDSHACACLLGSVLRFYVNSGYYWIDETNNTHMLTDRTMATMIIKMCKGRNLIGNYLSCGSQTWQKFKEYIQRIFVLSDEDVVSEEQARKFVREKLVTTGLPFWVMKYLDEERYGGESAKRLAGEIADNIAKFASGEHGSGECMENTIDLFAGTGRLRRNIEENFSDKKSLFNAFRTFATEAEPKLETLMKELALDPGDLVSKVKSMLQGVVYTWTEEDVAVRLKAVRQELDLVNEINKATGSSCKSMSAIREILKNSFDHMKVPGTVIESFEKDWVPSLKLLARIGRGDYAISDGETAEDLKIINHYAKSAWQHVKASKNLLNDYLLQKGITCTESELDLVFSSLKSVPYDSPESLFHDAVDQQMYRVRNARNKKELISSWEKLTGMETVRSWCREHSVPIQWVVEEGSLEHFEILKDVQEGVQIDGNRLEKAVSFFRNSDISYLNDRERIIRGFFEKVGKENREFFLKYREDLLKMIRNKLGADVYSWAMDALAIMNIIGDFKRARLREQHLREARSIIHSMSEHELKRRLSQLLEEQPELCEYFIGE